MDTADGGRSHMKRSTDRILTTHTGSLPRSTKVIELLLAEQQNRGARKAELHTAVGDAIAHVVQKQIESGIDVINDGEQGRTDYTVHVLDRLAGLRVADPETLRDLPADGETIGQLLLRSNTLRKGYLGGRRTPSGRIL